MNLLGLAASIPDTGIGVTALRFSVSEKHRLVCLSVCSIFHQIVAITSNHNVATRTLDTTAAFDTIVAFISLAALLT
jgi:hypothetical protein